jgi:hypothetical protein
MEEAAENGKESPHSAHGSGINENIRSEVGVALLNGLSTAVQILQERFVVLIQHQTSNIHFSPKLFIII